ncbi:hypothetical protein, partial [Ilumatobacter sp.]|uniref:hypothetical protein n=1 Tax=Ilumatobacter sp. TaxID=1967498 RepID=UPI003C62C99C
VTVPVVLPDALYFAGSQNSSAVVVDRTTWTVTGTHDLGLTVGISQNAYDGEGIYVGTYADADAAILIVDPDTYEVVDQIDVLNVNSLDVLDGSLWAVDEDLNILQRFDIAAGPPEPAQ